jgi:AcrR family transcriptional regulator
MTRRKRGQEDPVRQETERLMEMLRIFVRSLGYGNTEIARRSNIAHANVGRYFRGEARVPLEFVLAVVRGLGLEYSEFFELAYPEEPAEPTAARRKIERMLEILPVRRMEAPVEAPDWAPPEQVPPMPRPEIEKMLEKFRQEMQAKLDARQADEDHARQSEPPTRPEPPAPRGRKKAGKG